MKYALAVNHSKEAFFLHDTPYLFVALSHLNKKKTANARAINANPSVSPLINQFAESALVIISTDSEIRDKLQASSHFLTA
jgi:hypothetical protein